MLHQSFAWFPVVTGQAERMTGSLVMISPPLSIAYLPPLHWTVVHICCRENRPHLCKWEGHVLRHTPFTAAQQLVRSSMYVWVPVCPVDLAAYLQDVSLLYWTLSNSNAKLKQGVMRWCFHTAAAAAALNIMWVLIAAWPWWPQKSLLWSMWYLSKKKIKKNNLSVSFETWADKAHTQKNTINNAHVKKWWCATNFFLFPRILKTLCSFSPETRPQTQTLRGKKDLVEG